MNGFKVLLQCTVLFLLSLNGNAQQLKYELTAGPAISFASRKNNPASSNPLILPHAGFHAYIPFNSYVYLKTGLIYQLKGLKSERAGENEDMVTHNVYQSKTNFHFLSIPLQLAFQINTNKEASWTIAMGMSYNFLFYANTKLDVLTYDQNQLLQKQAISWTPDIGLSPNNNQIGTQGEKRDALHVFTPAVRLDVKYQWQRYVVGVFYEHHLQDVRARPTGGATFNMHYSGLALGILLK